MKQFEICRKWYKPTQSDTNKPSEIFPRLDNKERNHERNVWICLSMFEHILHADRIWLVYWVRVVFGSIVRSQFNGCPIEICYFCIVVWLLCIHTQTSRKASKIRSVGRCRSRCAMFGCHDSYNSKFDRIGTNRYWHKQVLTDCLPTIREYSNKNNKTSNKSEIVMKTMNRAYSTV